MAKQRMISTNFWKDSYVVDLDPSEKLLFNYLLTNPYTNVAGIYELNIREIAFDTGIDKSMVEKIIERFAADDKLTYKNNWLMLTNFIKHQSLNPSVVQGIQRVYNDLPSWVQKFATEVWHDHNYDSLLGAWVQPVDSLSTASLEPATGGGVTRTKLNLTKLNLTKPNLTKPNAVVVSTLRPEPIPTLIIEAMLDYWKSEVGMEVDTVSNRRAIAAILRQKAMSEIKLKQLVDGVVLSIDDKYAPRISDFVSLKRKMNDLIIWGRKRNMDDGRVVTI